MSSNNTTDNGTQHEGCPPSIPPNIVTLFMAIILVLVLCKICHLALSRLGQPRIIAELFVGIVIGNFKVADVVSISLMQAFPLLEGFSSSLYMFVLGLEMEPLAILQPPGPEAKIAYAGIFSTWAMFVLTYFSLQHIPFLAVINSKFLNHPRVLASFAIIFSATSSPILTHLVTELKLGQSEIGRQAIRAGLANDLFCSLLMCFLMAFRNDRRVQPLYILGWVTLEIIIVKYLVRHLLDWVNKRNPGGKPMKGMDMTIVLLTTQILCYSALFVLYDIKVNSFLIGLALPRRGRMSNFLIGKINYVLSTCILPLYLTMAGINLNLSMWNVDVNDKGDRPVAGAGSITFIRIIVITILATVGKLSGTLIVGLRHGLHWLEAVTLGMLLSIKGYLLIIFSIHAKSHNMMNENSLLVMMFAVILSIVYVPSTVSFIIRRVRMVKGGSARVMSIQCYNSVSELRVTVGLYGPQNVASALVLIETMRGGSDAAGIVVYALDMVEMTDEATLVYRQGTEEVMIADNAVVELREQIKHALDDYIQENNSGNDDISIGSSSSTSTTSVPNKITLRHNLAVSSFSTMHDDVHCCAQDSLSVLIVLPFHKSHIPEGDMGNISHSGVQAVNDNVLQNAPCSVGILVDRGLGKNRVRFTPASDPDVVTSQLNIVVVFIGGADDREALACAGIIANHPSVYLMAMRIIQDTETIQTDAPGRRLLAAIPPEEVEMEMKIDDEYFAGFYNHFISKGRIGYTEKHVRNGVQAVAALREVAKGENNYQLFIIGQGKDRRSMLTAGLSEWAQYPELGPIGDILAASDFPTDASVLVIRQHNPERNTKGSQDELDLFGTS